jgi:hypothetical protein
MPSLQQLIHSIDGRIDHLRSEISSLEAARSALTANGAAPTASSTAEPRPKPRKRRRQKTARKPLSRTPLTAETAEQLLANSDGMTTAALAEQAGASRNQVLLTLRELEQARRVRRTGQRRATRWHAITDEDRIRERAAELASRSRSRRSRA